MGCFYVRGCASKAIIEEGDKVVVILGIHNDQNDIYFPCDNIMPVALPIYGIYNDYGNLSSYKHDANTKWLNKHVGKIEDIIEAFSRCGCDISLTVGTALENWEEYSDIYNNLLKLSPYITKETKLAVCFEHASLFKKWQIKTNIFKEKIEKFEKERLPLLSEISKYYPEAKELISEPNSDIFSFVVSGRGFDYDRVLTLYRKGDNFKFLMTQVEAVTELERFIIGLFKKGICIHPVIAGQNFDCEEQIDYHKDCIKLLKNKIKKMV